MCHHMIVIPAHCVHCYTAHNRQVMGSLGAEQCMDDENVAYTCFLTQ